VPLQGTFLLGSHHPGRCPGLQVSADLWSAQIRIIVELEVLGSRVLEHHGCFQRKGYQRCQLI